MVSKVAAAMVWLGTDGSRRHAANSGKKFRARLLQWLYEVNRPAAFGKIGAVTRLLQMFPSHWPRVRPLDRAAPGGFV